jgi:hypothetical protein
MWMQSEQEPTRSRTLKQSELVHCRHLESEYSTIEFANDIHCSSVSVIVLRCTRISSRSNVSASHMIIREVRRV